MNDPLIEDDASTGIDSSEEFIAWVTGEGDHVVIAKDNELLIDIDTEEDYARHERSMEIFLRHTGVRMITKTTSRSGLPHRHITITLLSEITHWQRLALQAALGSDPVREILSSLRYMKGDPNPSLFREEGNEAQ